MAPCPNDHEAHKQTQLLDDCRRMLSTILISFVKQNKASQNTTAVEFEAQNVWVLIYKAKLMTEKDNCESKHQI